MSIMESYWLRTRAAQQKEEQHMKKWMALFLSLAMILVIRRFGTRRV